MLGGAVPKTEDIARALEMKSVILETGNELNLKREVLLIFMREKGIKSVDLNITLHCEFHDVFGW